MTGYSIASYGTHTITQPLSLGTDIDFLNNAGNDGVLIFTRGALGVSITGSPGSYASTAYFGGTITNFQPGAFGVGGDQVTIQVFESLFNAMDVASTAAADNAAFDGHVTFAAESGNQILIVDGTVQMTTGTPFALNANESQIIDNIALDLFGSAANSATLDIAFAMRTNPNSNHPFIDAVITTETPVNPCFAAGTRILTTRGEVAVEDLALGDFVITPDGGEQPIIWIGRREIDITRFQRPETVRPIIIEAGALGPDMPARTLVLSPDHALYLDGVLVPAKELINWNSIRQDYRIPRIIYYHIELPSHGIVFAEATPVESFLDTGHRGIFDNGESRLITHPSAMQASREALSCAPLCTTGPALEAIRQRIASRQVGIRLASR